MKVCVVGVGAVGGHLAARLCASGVQISVVARGSNLEAIAARGLILRDPDGEHRFPVAATDDPRALGPQDAVVFAVKAPDLPAAAAVARPLLSDDARAVFVTNGIPWWYDFGQEDRSAARAQQRTELARSMAALIDPARTVGAVLYSLCSVPEPGVVQVRNPVSRLCLGDIGNGPASQQTLRIADALRSPAVKVEMSDQIRDQVWEKLILLFATCPLSVLTGAAPVDIFKEPPCEEAARRLIQEGVAIASALGRTVRIDADAILAASRTSEHRPSILQDLDKGRPMEVDALFSVPLDMARAAGVAVPTLELLTALVKVRARGAGLY